MRSFFSSFHPLTNFIYFSIVLFSSIFILNTITLALSFLGGVIYFTLLNKKGLVRFNLGFIVPLSLFFIILNPLFDHNGQTILFYITDNIPITLESICYGIFTGFLIFTVFIWFDCFNAIITSDKLMYLLSRVLPSISVIVYVIFHYVPVYTDKIKEIISVQKNFYNTNYEGKTIKTKFKYYARAFNAFFAFALESSIITSESMKSRGYFLKNKSRISIYKFRAKDIMLLFIMILISIFIIFEACVGKVSFGYNMDITLNLTFSSVIIYLCYFVLYFVPIVLEISEDIKWKLLRSRI